MKNHFSGCTSLDEAKALYRKLVMQLHPDVSGYDSTEDFKAMQNQFEAFRPSAEQEKFKGEFEQWRPDIFMAVIEQLSKLEGIAVEVCGSFIWIGGNTYPHRAAIKATETGDYFHPAAWHHKKQLWYFSPLGYRKRSGNELGMDEIRSKYGSEFVGHKWEGANTLTA
ncbi:MAG: J domain-containing protein [Saprospiraceae bacterium]|nr:J domain-containing protein [Saprospiraceae bacterium]MCF8250954.1 J domain-containing protein [Saprospiraceae bacterium]MCF8281931.1 J domain-containing protein [Bacteroidales bacterium]MCF8311918.1 J domain-containing protein [Saprospiraceae bacterium]MCF8441926.1 J domain-containing protein [Saprospiraceae bacterium]